MSFDLSAVVKLGQWASDRRSPATIGDVIKLPLLAPRMRCVIKRLQIAVRTRQPPSSRLLSIPWWRLYQLRSSVHLDTNACKFCQSAQRFADVPCRRLHPDLDLSGIRGQQSAAANVRAIGLRQRRWRRQWVTCHATWISMARKMSLAPPNGQVEARQLTDLHFPVVNRSFASVDVDWK